MNKKVLWFDVETSGLNPRKQDIIQLAYLVDIDGEIKEEGSFKCQPFDYSTIDAKALEISKTTVNDLKNYITPKQAYNGLLQIIDKYVDRYDKEDKFSPAGYNVKFDVDFLREFFSKNGDKYYGAMFDYHLLSVDTLLYLFDYKGLIELENYKLVTVAKHFGIELNAHDALSDIKATRQVFYKLLEYFK